MPNISTLPRTELANATIGTAQLEPGCVTPSRQAAAGNQRVLTFEVSFESFEQGARKVYFGNNGVRLDSWRVFVTRTLNGTDSGTITLKSSAGQNITPNAVATLAPLAPFGTESNQAGLTTNNQVAAGDFVTFTTAKPTAGGKAAIQVFYTILS